MGVFEMKINVFKQKISCHSNFFYKVNARIYSKRPSYHRQACSQKFAMGGCFEGLRMDPPALENFALFCKNNLILGLF